MIRKIISGAQTGADIGGLIAAKKLGIETGGTMPKGFRTLDGPKPEYAKLYNIVEHESSAYPPRTACNVRDSDATMRFATNWRSDGEILTLGMILQYKKPRYDVDLYESQDVDDVRHWIRENRVQILNVAGNSEQTSPGIQDFVVEFLVELLGGQG